jgi:hypothetical protein
MKTIMNGSVFSYGWMDDNIGVVIWMDDNMDNII